MKSLFIALTLFFISEVSADSSIKVTGELEALKTDNFTPPRVKGIWQYTIAYMAEDGTVVQPGAPVLMFKTDAIQTKLVNAKGKLGIKQSEIKNKKVNKVENFEKKSILIEEKKNGIRQSCPKSRITSKFIGEK